MEGDVSLRPAGQLVEAHLPLYCLRLSGHLVLLSANCYNTRARDELHAELQAVVTLHGRTNTSRHGGRSLLTSG